MFITRHGCVNFRNISSLEIEPSRGVNVICGQNGQGKTNLIESIFLLTGARSFRRGKDASLIKKGEAASRIKADFYVEQRAQHIVVAIGDRGRTASLNGGSEQKAASLAGKIRCVVFSPEHLALVKGAPDNRRRFLDTALCQLSPAYLANLKQYSRLLAQRNTLIKDMRYIGAAEDMLCVYNEKFVMLADYITRQRRRFTAALRDISVAKYEKVSQGAETMQIAYESSMFGNGEDTATALEILRRSRGEEQKAGYSLFGPHRDDIVITLGGEDSRIFASQGQQRSIVLALKLAETELMSAAGDEKPILLLDDVLSELDESRRDCLLDGIEDTQAFITCCEPQSVLERCGERAEVFRMDNGALV